MAAWQALFQIVPDGPFPADYKDRLDEIAPRYRSWSEDILAWGSEDGDRVEVFHDAGIPSEAGLRIDMRRLDPAFITGVLAWVRDTGLRLLDLDERQLDPTPGEFALALRGSRAYRFVENPERYLTRLGLGGLDDA
jgi:hypothetical protein